MLRQKTFVLAAAKFGDVSIFTELAIETRVDR